MKGAKIQKPWIDTLFRGRKVSKLLTYLKFELNIDFIHQGVFLRMYKDTFLNVEITTIIAGNFETILSVNVTREKRL